MDSDGFIMNIGEERDMAETKELTIEQRAIAATHNILHHATTLEYRENMMSYIIREAEERGRVEMRERCAVGLDELNVASGCSIHFKHGYQCAVIQAKEFIRSLPTSEESVDQKASVQAQGSTIEG